MARSTYAPKEIYTGNGALDTYTFDFKIEDEEQLLVIEVDDDGVETERVRGDDTTYLSSVTFDAEEGGGTVVLADNLPTDYSLILLLANDEPTQPYEFRNKTSFTLRRFEMALDFIAGAIQRLAYRANQSLRMHDLDDEDTFDMQLPPEIDQQADKVIVINSDGDGLEFGPTTDEISNAQSYGEAAALSEAAAALSEAAAAASESNASASEAAAAASELACAGYESTITTYLTPYANENISEGGNITCNTNKLQMRRVTGNGGAVTTSNTPFGTNPSLFSDGMKIILIGQNDTNVVNIPDNDVQYGCILNGDAQLAKGHVLELIYDGTLERFVGYRA